MLHFSLLLTRVCRTALAPWHPLLPFPFLLIVWRLGQRAVFLASPLVPEMQSADRAIFSGELSAGLILSTFSVTQFICGTA